jgi:hypothetical protein
VARLIPDGTVPVIVARVGLIKLNVTGASLRNAIVCGKKLSPAIVRVRAPGVIMASDADVIIGTCGITLTSRSAAVSCPKKWAVMVTMLGAWSEAGAV